MHALVNAVIILLANHFQVPLHTGIEIVLVSSRSTGQQVESSYLCSTEQGPVRNNRRICHNEKIENDL